jgi:Protein of unknown function (DUF4012)
VTAGRLARVTQPKRRAAHRLRALIALAIAVLILASGGAASALAYSTVKAQAGQLQAQLTAHLQVAQGELEAAKASLKQANANHDIKLVSQAQAHFIAARAQFMVTSQMADSNQLLHQLEGLPDVGDVARSRQAAVDGIAQMGVAISDAGVELSSLAAEIIAPPSGGSAGRTLLTVLDQANTSLVKVRADLQRADKAAASVDIQVVPVGQQATFLKARTTIGDALASMGEFQAFIPIINEVLGGNGARTYLIEQVNPAELRPGGGLIGTYSVLRADQGTLKLIRSGNAYDLADPRPLQGQRGYVAPPGPLRQLIGTTSWSFVDSNFFPDFPSNAITAENFVQPRLGVKIDAVISMDYYTVAKMLEVTGPLQVPGYGVTVNSTNFILLVMGNSLTQNAINKSILSAIAGPLMQRVSSLPPERWPALLGILNDLASARHLQVYFNNQSVETQVTQFGWSGGLNTSTSYDFMAEVEGNLGATKANYFVTRHYTVVLTKKGSLLHHKVTVDLVNNTPYFYRPNDYYAVYFRLIVSGNASSLSDNLSRGQYASPSAPAGTQQLAGWLNIPGYGNRGEAIFEYDTPWVSIWRGEYQIYWEKQQGTLTDKVDVTWNDGSGHAYSASGDLSQDRVITLTGTGILLGPAQPAQAKLPSLSLG